MSAVEFELVGYEPSELQYTHLMVDLLADRLFGTPRQFPPLRSSLVTIQRIGLSKADGSCAKPVYIVGGTRELIQLPSQERYYWQFGYQLAHELSHLAARADQRFPRLDGLHWIEEAMCECYSLIGMNAVANQPGYLQQNARSYLLDGTATFHRASHWIAPGTIATLRSLQVLRLCKGQFLMWRATSIITSQKISCS